jgi:hypothetical protein
MSMYDSKIKKTIFTFLYLGLLTLLPLFSQSALADGSVIDKIYHPYVDALENELEFRSIFQDKQAGLDNPKEIHRLALGRSIGESLFGEVYLIGNKSRSGSFDLEAYEFELKWQLTEQGEYAADWGVLFEFEKEIDEDAQEVAVGLFAEKEFGRWSGTANLFLIREWGEDIENEYETALSLQARYRYSRSFEPAIELYTGQDTTGIGPAVIGNFALGTRKSLNWEAGLILGIDNESPDQTFRFLLEYEF